MRIDVCIYKYNYQQTDYKQQEDHTYRLIKDNTHNNIIRKVI